MAENSNFKLPQHKRTRTFYVQCS